MPTAAWVPGAPATPYPAATCVHGVNLWRLEVRSTTLADKTVPVRHSQQFITQRVLVVVTQRGQQPPQPKALVIRAAVATRVLNLARLFGTTASMSWVG